MFIHCIVKPFLYFILDYVLSAVSSQTAPERWITSAEVNITTSSCLKLSYILEEGVMEIAVFNRTGIIGDAIPRISRDSVFPQWSRFHVPLSAGITRIRFIAYPSATVSLDNITISDENCPASRKED